MDNSNDNRGRKRPFDVLLDGGAEVRAGLRLILTTTVLLS